jgi:hypothetical protein
LKNKGYDGGYGFEKCFAGIMLFTYTDLLPNSLCEAIGVDTSIPRDLSSAIRPAHSGWIVANRKLAGNGVRADETTSELR